MARTFSAPADTLESVGDTLRLRGWEIAVKGSVRQTTINESFGPICARINKTTSVKGSRVLHFYISSSFLSRRSQPIQDVAPTAHDQAFRHPFQVMVIG